MLLKFYEVEGQFPGYPEEAPSAATEPSTPMRRARNCSRGRPRSRKTPDQHVPQPGDTFAGPLVVPASRHPCRRRVRRSQIRTSGLQNTEDAADA